jgi:hypothetical protein
MDSREWIRQARARLAQHLADVEASFASGAVDGIALAGIAGDCVLPPS